MSDAQVGRPLPLPDAGSAEFFDAANRRELVVQRCCDCHKLVGPVKPRCNHCFSPDLEWITVSGRATLYSFTLVHQRLHPGFADEIPYNASLVDLEEGVRLLSRVVGIPNDELQCGMALVVDFEEWGPGVLLPVFRPAPASAASAAASASSPAPNANN